MLWTLRSGRGFASVIAVGSLVVASCLLAGAQLFRSYSPAAYRTIRLAKESTNFTEEGDCTVATCLNLLPCSLHDDLLTVYLEPITTVFDESGREITPPPSREFLYLRSVVAASAYRVDSPEDACLVLPGVDTLNVHRFPQGTIGLRRALTAHNRFEKQNILLFVFVGVEISAGSAILVRGQSERRTFRRGFDVSAPVWFDWDAPLPPAVSEVSAERQYRIAVVLRYASDEVRSLLLNTFHDEGLILILDECDNVGSLLCDSNGSKYSLHSALLKSEFTLVFDRVPSFEIVLMSALRSGSIPFIVSDVVVLPFSEVVDWERISLSVCGSRLPSVVGISETVSEQRRRAMRLQIAFVYGRYFSSLERIVLTSLRILQSRFVASSVTFGSEWNTPYTDAVSPLFLPRIAPPEGFTAVVLAYNRIESLFALIRLLARVPSLVGVLVVWNNVNLKPPPATEWPHIGRTVRVIRMKENRLSNRFIAFSEIPTEAVFSLDDDISTLTVDEIEFGFQTWRENPDRLVGFLPRTNVYNSSTNSYSYNSEWSNNMSIVLTGAAFFHKYYGVLYHTVLNDAIKQFVETNLNCEDIAMNFLIGNLTRKCALKVTPRKKFVCPHCSNNEIAPWDVPRIVQRSECVNKFIAMMGADSLLSSVYRVDPVLYKAASNADNPYADVGAL